MQLGLGWIFVGAYAVENGRSIDIALLPASSLYHSLFWFRASKYMYLSHVAFTWKSRWAFQRTIKSRWAQSFSASRNGADPPDWLE